MNYLKKTAPVYLLHLLVVFLFFACKSDRAEQDLSKDTPSSEAREIMKECTGKNCKMYDDTRYIILSGESFFESGQLSVSLQKSPEHIILSFKIILDDTIQYPVVYNSRFKMEEEASVLRADLHVKTDKNTLYSDSRSININTKSVEFKFYIMPENFKSLPAGKHDIELTFNTEFISAFDVKSGIGPVQTSIKTTYNVNPVYKSVFYFESAKLNEKETYNKLNNGAFANDTKNGAPEIRMVVSFNNYPVFEKNSKNAYEIHAPEKVEVYHVDASGYFNIQFEDKDYFLNGNDYITDTTFSIKDLEGDTYKTFSFKCVDEIKIYCKNLGRVN